MQAVALYFSQVADPAFSSCVLPFCAWTQSGTLLVYLCQSTAVLACLSAKWDELFLCSDKADLEHQPGLLGPFALLGSFLWDRTKWLPAEAKICSLISMTLILLLILLIPLSIFNSSVSWWLQSSLPLPLCSCFSLSGRYDSHFIDHTYCLLFVPEIWITSSQLYWLSNRVVIVTHERQFLWLWGFLQLPRKGLICLLFVIRSGADIYYSITSVGLSSTHKVSSSSSTTLQ